MERQDYNAGGGSPNGRNEKTMNALEARLSS